MSSSRTLLAPSFDLSMHMASAPSSSNFELPLHIEPVDGRIKKRGVSKKKSFISPITPRGETEQIEGISMDVEGRQTADFNHHPHHHYLPHEPYHHGPHHYHELNRGRGHTLHHRTSMDMTTVHAPELIQKRSRMIKFLRAIRKSTSFRGQTPDVSSSQQYY